MLSKLSSKRVKHELKKFEDKEKKAQGKLTEKETSAEGSVSLSALRRY